MPYIAIKAYPKDEETKKKVVEEINNVMLKYWGCPPQAITISVESFEPEIWKEKVFNGEIKPNEDKMFILQGEKKF